MTKIFPKKINEKSFHIFRKNKALKAKKSTLKVNKETALLNEAKFTNFGPHTAHMVDVSPWPFFISMSLYATVIKFTAYLHGLEDYTFF